MKSPGTQLREARKSRGLSIAEAASLTRIPKTLLENLEADSVDEFQADVFLFGHIRNYARELGLDGDALVRQFERRNASSASSSSLPKLPAEATRTPAKRSRRPVSRPQVRPTHMFAIVLVLAGLGIFASLLSSGRATAKDPAQFPEAQESEWELEQDAQDTRWLLEQPEGQ